MVYVSHWVKRTIWREVGMFWHCLNTSDANHSRLELIRTLEIPPSVYFSSCLFYRRYVNNLEKVRLNNSKYISLLLTSQGLTKHVALGVVGGHWQWIEYAKSSVLIWPWSLFSEEFPLTFWRTVPFHGRVHTRLMCSSSFIIQGKQVRSITKLRTKHKAQGASLPFGPHHLFVLNCSFFSNEQILKLQWFL